jgi:hypothetical protein
MTEFKQSTLAFLCGCILIVSAFKLLVYGTERADYFMMIGIFGGFIIFATGGFLILFSLFPEYAPL